MILLNQNKGFFTTVFIQRFLLSYTINDIMYFFTAVYLNFYTTNFDITNNDILICLQRFLSNDFDTMIFSK